MSLTRTALTLGLTLAAATTTTAQAADPVGALDRVFSEYTGTGPIGNNDINDDTTVYWFKEKSGTFMSQSVQSWFVFWDPRNALTAKGTITFDQPILAILISQATLQASSPTFGKPSVTYDYSNAAVGLETADAAATSFAGAVLTMEWFASSPGDHIRVLTAIPEPASMALLLAGLGLVAARQRRAG